jgi:hypothetical protein
LILLLEPLHDRPTNEITRQKVKERRKEIVSESARVSAIRAVRLEAVTPAGTRYAVTGHILRDMARAEVVASERARA